MPHFRTLMILCACVATPLAVPAVSAAAETRAAAPMKLSDAKRARFQAAVARKFPRGSHAIQTSLIKRLTPDGREWVARSAYAFATGQVTEDELRRVSKPADYIATFGVAEQDIDALIFIVMMQAAKSAQEDLKDIMDGVKLINKQKEGLRKTQERINKLAAATAGMNECNGEATNGPCENEEDRYIPPSIPMDATDGRDSMSELGEMESLRLQTAMDRLSKMMSTLSNILKKASDTSQSITQNIK